GLSRPPARAAAGETSFHPRGARRGRRSRRRAGGRAETAGSIGGQKMKILDQIRELVTGTTVFREPYEKNGVTVIAALQVSGGGGGVRTPPRRAAEGSA